MSRRGGEREREKEKKKKEKKIQSQFIKSTNSKQSKVSYVTRNGYNNNYPTDNHNDSKIC